VFIPLRAIPPIWTRTTASSLIISRNISVSAQFFSNYRDYPQGEIHSLYWDGVGMSLQWKTARIKGTVTDYALADLDNDGALDLVVNINTHTGMAGTAKKKTLVVAYPLDLSKGNEFKKLYSKKNFTFCLKGPKKACFLDPDYLNAFSRRQMICFFQCKRRKNMKRFALVALLAAMLFGVASSASATELKVKGQLGCVWHVVRQPVGS
jgi:hypothetical protein